MDHSMPQTSRSNPPKVDSLFKRTEQVVSLSDRKYSARQKANLPSLTVGESSSKVGKSGKGIDQKIFHAEMIVGHANVSAEGKGAKK